MFGVSLEKISKLAEKNNADKLTKLAQDKNEEIKLAAIAGLGRCSSDIAYNTLVSLLHDVNPKARAAAATALHQYGNPSARSHIEHQLVNETDEAIKQTLHDALKGLRNNQ